MDAQFNALHLIIWVEGWGKLAFCRKYAFLNIEGTFLIIMDHGWRIKMKPSKCYRKNSHIVTTELEDGAILLNLNTKFYYNLNETGLCIWRVLDESSDPETIATKLTDVYDIDRKQASSYLTELLEDLEKEGLIVGAI